MANLQFIKNVNHNGMIFKGQQIENNQIVAEGMIVDPSTELRKPGVLGLADLAQDLIDRGLARATDAPATHSATLVNGAQEAITVDAPAGSGVAPSADVIRQREALQKSAQPAAPAAAPAVPAQSAPAPAQPQQPSAEEIAAIAG
jgi:hypothetical protein